MPTQNLLRLLLLLMLVMRNGLLQIWKLRLIKKLNFCSDLEHKFGQDFEVEVEARIEAGVWLVFFC